MVGTPLFTHLSITFSNKRFSNCGSTMDFGFVNLALDSFCGNSVIKINIQFCCHLYCSTMINCPSQCTMISFSQCWFLPTVPFRLCHLPIIRVRQHKLRNPTMWQFSSQMRQRNAHQQSILFQNWTGFPFSDSFTRTVPALIRALQSVNKR
jgi:hypothetical protein